MRRAALVAVLAGVLAPVLGGVLAPAAAASPALVQVTDLHKAQPGRRLNAAQALAIAGRVAKIRALRRAHPSDFPAVYEKEPLRWQVSWFDRGGEAGQVLIDDHSGRVLEAWTGIQVAWTMARGYAGAFGRKAGALYVWIPLCLLFVAPFFDRRRPWRLLHLDLLMLLGFSVSLAAFDNADIALSVPSAYPPLLYLLARLLWVGLRGGRRPSRLVLNVPVSWLVIGVIFLVGFRVSLNVTDSNVIDVGYAGVIGARHLAWGKPIYGHFPADNVHGDTYGPVVYAAYVPFVEALGFSGRWDDLPAAHGASIFFDLLCVGLLFFIGRRIRGPTLGVVLAYGWVANPFTLFTLDSNTNDPLVAALVLATLLVAERPLRRGVAGRSTRAGRARAVALFGLGFLGVGALSLLGILPHDTLGQFWDRAILSQADRTSPFSVWGLYGGLGWAQSAVRAGAVVLAVGLAVVPRRGDVVGLAASAGAILIAVQLGVAHWFYLYIPWFLGPALVALLGRHEDLLDRVGAQALARADHDPHHPGVLLGG